MSWPPRRPIPPSLSTIVVARLLLDPPRYTPPGEKESANAAVQPCYMQRLSQDPRRRPLLTPGSALGPPARP